MRTTLTSIIALGFAVTSANAVLAAEHEIDIDDDFAIDHAEDRERFEQAGFEGARVMGEAEVARVTHDGETFYVVHGLDDRIGMQMDRTGVQPGDQAAQPGDMQQDDLAADDPLATETQPGIDTAEDPAVTQPGIDTAEDHDLAVDEDRDLAVDPDTAVGAPMDVAEHRTLEELLEQAGIEDYEILDDVRVASTRLGEGIDAREVYVVYGLDHDEADM